MFQFSSTTTTTVPLVDQFFCLFFLTGKLHVSSSFIHALLNNNSKSAQPIPTKTCPSIPPFVRSLALNILLLLQRHNCGEDALA